MRAATISFAELQVRLLFEGGYYSRCGFNSVCQLLLYSKSQCHAVRVTCQEPLAARLVIDACTYMCTHSYTHTMSKLTPQHECRGLNIADVAKLMLAYLWYALSIVGGLILGDPNGQFICMDHPTVKLSDICGVEVLSKAASK